MFLLRFRLWHCILRKTAVKPNIDGQKSSSAYQYDEATWNVEMKSSRVSAGYDIPFKRGLHCSPFYNAVQNLRNGLKQGPAAKADMKP